MRRSFVLVFLIFALIVAGCVQNESTNVNETNTTPVNESSQPHHLKNIIIEDLGNNTTKITVVYEFPSAAYNVTLNGVRVKNGTAVLFVEVNKTTEPAAQVITTRNITVTLNYSIDTAMVLTADVE